MERNASTPALIEGIVAPEFHEVRREFERNFTERGEQGAACAIYHRGQKVVDLWGGQRCGANSLPWTERTLSLVFSVSKGMAAAAMAVAHSRGLFELDQPVARYWPEFRQRGKGDVTVRQLLAHQSGLIAVDQPLGATELANHDVLAEVLARQQPAWLPGMKHGYHTLTLGWYQSEIIRRVDPQGRSLGAFFRDEVAAPLQAEFYIGLPSHIDEQRLARTDGFHRTALLWHLNELPLGMVLSGIWPRSLVARSVNALGLQNPADIGNLELRGMEIPSANGIGEARAIARIYGSLATGGRELGITPQTWQELIAPPTLPQLGSYDAILKIDTQYSFGFSRPSRAMQFGSGPTAMGCPGAGGSLGMADPDAQLGFAYVTNKMGFRLFDDVREKAVRDACYRCLDAMRSNRRAA
ncbi:MAG TPA: serine hydrolase domain-containing protein [Pirellulaceae bacterium]|nr:serine hydrolase domain-containing protein [Pirellulaceae bacterium]